MGKKPQRFTWPEAKKRCRLNQQDIAMAKALGFSPDGLVRNIPDPKQRWKAPVKIWIRDLYEDRFGHVLGEKPYVPPPPLTPEEQAEEARRFEEEMYWEDYHDRNADDTGKSTCKQVASEAHTPRVEPNAWSPEFDAFTDDDVPF
jgi:hypothetical protein